MALAADVPRSPALVAATGVLRARVEEELRSRRGVAYAVGVEQVPLDARRRVVVLSSDARPGETAVVARLLWREVQRLADEGPLPAELDHDRALVAEYLDDPRSEADAARASACGRVTGVPVATGDELRAEVERLDAEEVRTAAAALPEWSADRVTGRVFRAARRRGAPRDAVLVVGDEGVSADLGDGRLLTVRWADAVGLVRSAADGWHLVGRDGTGVPLTAADWRDGVLLLQAPVHRVREAVGTSRDEVSLVAGAEWTAVVPGGARPAEERALQFGAAAGPRTTALVLRLTHADLEYVLYRGGRELDRHRWGVAPGDPAVLARGTGRPVDEVAAVLADPGPPAEVLERLTALLGLPAQVADLLAGREVAGAERVEGRGIAGGVRAAVRGDYAPAPGSGSWVDRWARLGRDRPAGYRIANGVAALALSVVAWVQVGDGQVGFGVLAAVLGLFSLVEVRPPRRGDRSADRPAAEVTPTG